MDVKLEDIVARDLTWRVEAMLTFVPLLAAPFLVVAAVLAFEGWISKGGRLRGLLLVSAIVALFTCGWLISPTP